MEIQTLPYIAPDPGLTANVAPRSLKEHYLAFLARHNALVDAPEEQRCLAIQRFAELTFDTSLVDVLLFVSQQDHLSDAEMEKVRMFVRVALKKADSTSVIGRQEQHQLIHAMMGWNAGGQLHLNGCWFRNSQIGKLQKRVELFTN